MLLRSLYSRPARQARLGLKRGSLVRDHRSRSKCIIFVSSDRGLSLLLRVSFAGIEGPELISDMNMFVSVTWYPKKQNGTISLRMISSPHTTQISYLNFLFYLSKLFTITYYFSIAQMSQSESSTKEKLQAWSKTLPCKL